MTSLGDDGHGMTATRALPDDVIEAIIRDEAVHTSCAPLVAFARQVRALGDEPVPAASAELAALLEGRTTPQLGSADAARTLVANHRAPRIKKVAGMTSKVASLGLVAKMGLGTSLAAATVLSAGAAGVLPAAANNTVRDAIEVVLPVEFPNTDDNPNDTGDRLSGNTTRESDGTTGVEGHETADNAPGAEHRSGSGAADEPPGQSGDTGLTQANQTPAAPHAPDSAPSTVPSHGHPDDPGQASGNPPSSVPSTGPPYGGQAEDHKPGE